MKALELRCRLSLKHEVHGRCFTVLTKLLLVGLVAAGCAGPQGPAVGEIVRSGLCIQEVGGRYSQPQSTAGYATTGPLTLTDRTTEVPLRQGVAFGYAWKASNLPNPAVITYRVEHPAITRPDGVSMSRFEEELEVETVGGKPLAVREEGRRPGDPAYLVARADRIRQELGWRPRYDDLEAIVTHSLAWERKLLENPWS